MNIATPPTALAPAPTTAADTITPVLVTIAVVTVVTSWNAFLLPLLVLTDPSSVTLSIGVNYVSSQYITDTARILAYTTLSMVPALVIYALAERQIVGGPTAKSLDK